MADTIKVKIGGQRNTRNTHKSNNTGWRKTEPSLQDLVSQNPTLIRQHLQDYDKIDESEYSLVQIGTYIRYLKVDGQGRPQIRFGGYLIKNAYPDYWVLKNHRQTKTITWCVPLKSKNVYFKRKGHDEKMKYGKEIYEGLASGRYLLVKPETIGVETATVTPKTKFKKTFDNDKKQTPPRQPIRARFRDD